MSLTEPPSGADGTDPRATIRPDRDPRDTTAVLGVVVRESAPLPQGDGFRTLPSQRTLEPPAQATLVVSHSFIGEGAGVRLVRQAGLDRPVLLKQAPREQDTPGGSAALQREARILGALDHPNVPPVHVLEFDGEGAPHLLMAALAGSPWSERLLGEGRSRGDALEAHLEILLELCRAVRFAHSRDILHLDLKPTNVVLGEHGQVYLTGWNMARRRDELDSSEYLPLGTPTYMAPEIVDPLLEISERTDVYGLGSLLYEILSGWPPHAAPTEEHTHDDETRPDPAVDDLLGRVREGRVPALPEDAPPEISRVAMRALARDPADRYGSVAHFEEALSEAIRHRSARSVSERGQELLARLEDLAARPFPPTAERGSRSPADDEIQEVFSACRFAFEQVLRDLPEHAEARRGLERCLVLMTGHDVDAHNLESAEALLADIVAPPIPLVERVAALRVRRDAARAAQHRLDEARRSARIPGTRYERSFGALSFGVLTSIGLVLAPRLGPPEELVMFFAGGVAVLFGTVVAWLLRERYLGSHFNRWALRIQNLIFATAALIAGMSFALDLDPLLFLVGTPLVGATGAAVLAATLAPFLWVAVVYGVVIMFVIVLNPEWGYEILAVSYLAIQAYLAWELRPGPDGRIEEHDGD